MVGRRSFLFGWYIFRGELLNFQGVTQKFRNFLVLLGMLSKDADDMDVVMKVVFLRIFMTIDQGLEEEFSASVNLSFSMEIGSIPNIW